MKLGELCDVMNAEMLIKYSYGKKKDLELWVHEIAYQQRLYRCKDFVDWDVVGISGYHSEPNTVIVEIVKPEEE